MQDAKSELLQDKYKNVFEGDDTELKQHAMQLLKTTLSESQGVSTDLLIHTGFVKIKIVVTTLPRLQDLINNARSVVETAVEEIEVLKKPTRATFEICRQYANQVKQIMDRAEVFNKEVFDAIKIYLDEHPESVNVSWPGFAVTPLHECACSGLTELTKLLLERGADCTARNSFGQTPAERCRAMGRFRDAELIEQWPQRQSRDASPVRPVAQ